MGRLCKKWLAIILSLSLAISLVPTVAFAAENEDFSYVSLGASNVNGYGLHGYLDETYYQKPWTLTNETDISGYQKAPEGSYPDLIRDALEQRGKNVKLDQLAFSGMRMEEVRMLLDEGYTGDAYTAWRFYGGQKWFQRAVNSRLPAEQAQSEPEALATLRSWYQDAISGADLITFDVGANNFGVYTSNRIFNGMYSDDVESLLDGDDLDQYLELKAKIEEKLLSYVDTGDLEQEDFAQLKLISSTYAYSVIGFCTNFDVAMGKILELNPNADIVVLSIQNMMTGMTAQIGDAEIPLGDLHGALTNLANIYMAIGSPYHDKYYYADVREKGRVTAFVDDFTSFDGKLESITDEMKDCFDVYIQETGSYLKDNIQHLVYDNIIKAAFGQATPDFEEIDFTQLSGYGEYGPAIDSIYNVALNNAYMAVTKVLQEMVKENTIHLDEYVSMSDYNRAAEKYLLAGLSKISEKAAILGVYDVVKGEPAFSEIAALCLQQLQLPGDKKGETSFNVDKAVEGLVTGDVTKVLTMQEIRGLFTGTDTASKRIQSLFDFDLAAENPIQTIKFKPGMEALVQTVANIGARISISNSFCSHPNRVGHEELKDLILKAWDNKSTGPEALALALEKSENTLKKYIKDWDQDLFEKIVECIKADAVDNLLSSVAELPEGLDLTIEQQVALLQVAMSFADTKDFDTLCDALAQIGFVTEEMENELQELNSDNGLSMTISDLLAMAYYYSANDDANFARLARPMLTKMVQNADANIDISSYGILGPLVNMFTQQQVQQTKQQFYNQINSIRTIAEFKRFLENNSSYIDPQQSAEMIESLENYGGMLVKLENSGQLLNTLSLTVNEYIDHPERLLNPGAKGICSRNEVVTLNGEGGKYSLFAGNANLGEYAFLKNGNGWTIQNTKTNEYLAIADSALVNSASPYVWKYNNDCFSSVVTVTNTTTTGSTTGIFGIIGSLFGGGSRTTSTTTDVTYYLVCNDGHELTIGTNATNCPVIRSVFDADSHALKAVSAVDPTCNAAGNEAYWICERCGAMFKDEKGAQPTTIIDIIIQKIDHEFKDGKCIYCESRDPAFIPECVSEKAVSLGEGTLVFTLGGHELGEYTFTRSGNNWTIKDSSGKYLGFANNSLSDNAFAWTYNNGRFQTTVTSTNGSGYGMWNGSGGSRTTTYYLVYANEKINVSTNATGAAASFAEKVENLKHSFGNTWTTDQNGKHSKTCSVCGDKLFENCIYDQEGHKCVCGRIDPNLTYVTATFETGEGASTAPDKQTVIKDEGVITEPATNPTKIGYLFDGWYVDNVPFVFNAVISKDVTITAKWIECTSHEYNPDTNLCTKCGAKDPEAVSHCSGLKTVSLKEGKLQFTLGGCELGEYTFTRSGNNWTIKDGDGKYLGFANNSLSDNDFAWTYNNGCFQTRVTVTTRDGNQRFGGIFGFLFGGFGGGNRTTTTTYYLVYANGNIAVSASNNGANASFKEYVESDEHSGAWKTAGKTHTRKCEVCGEEETYDCTYADHICTVCGGYNPDYVKIDVTVALSQRTSGGNQGFDGIFGFLFGGFGRNRTVTTYTATITTEATGTTVTRTEYSTNNGASWTRGNTITSNSQIGAFLIRVTDSNNQTHNYQYNGSTVIEQ